MALDDGTLSILKTWRKVQRTESLTFGFNTMSKDQLIFTNIDNVFLSPAKPRKWLVAIQEQYNLKKITVHGFSHTHCSLLFASRHSYSRDTRKPWTYRRKNNVKYLHARYQKDKKRKGFEVR